ncbi:uncharacterized protein LOC113324453 [Papaver somniferum]|uniref:uncharacterized protein LOC113324453 n=1 Tax=Papaver somniferum TaxID=3469 RepID=UPI000E6F96BC|nr:uncharacterized protein LOC113324453 [Papaver somniferum]
MRAVQRRILWAEMEVISDLNLTWLAISDFNAITSGDEKVGGKTLKRSSMMDFNNCLDTCALMQAPKMVLCTLGLIVNMEVKEFCKILRDWNWNVFGNINVHVKEAEAKVQEAMLNSNNNPFDEEALDNLVAAQNLHSSKEAQLYTFLKHESRNKWIKEGAANTGFLHAKLKIRQSKNSISELEDQDGNIISDQKQISEELIKYFEQKFKYKEVEDVEHMLNVIPEVITSDDQEMIEKVPDEEEIKAILFDMDQDSAPNPDGFSSCLYRSCWDIIHQEVVEAIQFCWRRRFIPKGLNSNFLVLIPKTEGARKPSQFRPIGLSNISFKIFRKILETRMGNLMHKLVSPQQVAYVKGICIQDQIILASELVNEMSSKRRCGNVALKLDISQAYDSIKEMIQMERSEFPDKYLGVVLIQGRVKTSTLWLMAEMMQKKLAAWKGKLLSFQERLVLIKSVMCSIPVYSMGIYKWPTSIIWKINKSDEEWALFFHAKYKDKNGQWSTKWQKSSVWPGLKWAWNALKDEIRWSIGDGTNISVWFDLWIGDRSLIKRFGYTDYIAANINLKVSDVMVDGKWSFDTELQTMIHNVRPPKVVGGEDLQVWTGDLKGKFSVSTPVNKLRRTEHPVRWCRFIWKNFIHPCVASNIWKLIEGVYTDDQKMIQNGGIGVATNYLAESYGVMNALELEVEWKLQDIIIVLDSKTVLAEFAQGKVHWFLKGRWKRAQGKVSKIRYHHCYREVNFSEDSIAKKGASLTAGKRLLHMGRPPYLPRIEMPDVDYFRFC